MDQRLIKPQAHTSLVFNLLFSPQRPRAAEEEREGIATFFASVGEMISKDLPVHGWPHL